MLLGMADTHYVEPTGLSSNNQSSAQDLARLVKASFEHPIIRQLSTSLEAVVPVGARLTQFRNTNGLVRNPNGTSACRRLATSPPPAAAS
jgi:D-alanyl-D-alanine endopeptidase (penicillin-binding protein 7)